MTLHQHINKQVANLAVLFVKIHHFHWYVKGTDFFVLHEHLEKLYDEVNDTYDTVAERLIAIGGKPASNMKNYLSLTSLVEASTEASSKDMIKSLVEDLTSMVAEFKELIKVSTESKDDSTADLFIGLVTLFEKRIWMYSAYLK